MSRGPHSTEQAVFVIALILDPERKWTAFVICVFQTPMILARDANHRTFASFHQPIANREPSVQDVIFSNEPSIHMSGWYMMVKWYTANQSGRYADEMF
jgi:hypothetical protein